MNQHYSICPIFDQVDTHTESTISLAKGAEGHNRSQLEDGFLPGDDDVICGRGRRIFEYVGNQRFRQLVALHLDEYSAAKTRIEKTNVLAKIVTLVRLKSPKGGFVKKSNEDNKWYEVGDFLAREKTSQAFRDILHQKYSSSNEAKRRKRSAKSDVDYTFLSSEASFNSFEHPLTQVMRSNKRRMISLDSIHGLAAGMSGLEEVQEQWNFEWGVSPHKIVSSNLISNFLNNSEASTQQLLLHCQNASFGQPEQSCFDTNAFIQALQVQGMPLQAVQNNLSSEYQETTHLAQASFLEHTTNACVNTGEAELDLNLLLSRLGEVATSADPFEPTPVMSYF